MQNMAKDSQEPLFNQAGLCQYLLDNVTSSPDLEIRQSLITGAGSALFTKTDIADGEQVFQSQPLVSVVLDRGQNVCEYCFRDGDSRVHPSGRFRSRQDALEVFPSCEQCGISSYCSKVSVKYTRFHEKITRLIQYSNCKLCSQSAMKAFHQHECKLFAGDPVMPAKYRALCRVLLRRKHGVISDQMWQALHKMESHYETRMAKAAEAKKIQGEVTGAKAMTNSEEDVECISRIYCIVSLSSSILFTPRAKHTCVVELLLAARLSSLPIQRCSRIISAYGSLANRKSSAQLSISSCL